MATGASDPVTTTSSGNTLIDGLLWGSQWSDGSGPTTTVNFYIADGGEPFDFGGDTVTAITDAQEVAAIKLALKLIGQVCGLSFVAVATQGEADLLLGTVNDADALHNLGIAVPPGEDTGPPADQQGAAIVNHDAYYTSDYSSLQQGGYDFISFIHELGHAIGLKHPHDRGGGAFPKFPGVNGAFDDYGDFDLNQGLYTMMTYNDGNPTGPLGPQSPSDHPEYGWEGGPMALDIAALQYLYGANMSFRTGNNTYTLPAANAAGTFFSCIWDAGGIDTIKAGADVACTINLNDATLLVGDGGGGFLSSHRGILGGFTIANGAVIENAVGAGRKDVLIGNEAVNVLKGNGNADTLIGGAGGDRLFGGPGRDKFVFSEISDSSVANFDIIRDFQRASDLIDLSGIDGDGAGAADCFDYIGSDAFSSVAGELRSIAKVSKDKTVILGDTDGDGVANVRIVLDGLFTLNDGHFIL